jgi:hypothetical protein
LFEKNSNFRGDHNSEDRWQPRWKFPWGLSGATEFSAYDPLLALAVASTRGDNAFRAEVGFSRHINFRLFQQYLRKRDAGIRLESTSSGHSRIPTADLAVGGKRGQSHELRKRSISL